MFFNYKPHAHYIADALCNEAVDQHASGERNMHMQTEGPRRFSLIDFSKYCNKTWQLEQLGYGHCSYCSSLVTLEH